METLKPGTRCECETRHDGHHVGPLFRECKAEAVRLVTVYSEEGTWSPKTLVGRSIPLCAACAEFHERDKAERETASAIHAIHGLPGEPEPEGGREMKPEPKWDHLPKGSQRARIETCEADVWQFGMGWRWSVLDANGIYKGGGGEDSEENAKYMASLVAGL